LTTKSLQAKFTKEKKAKAKEKRERNAKVALRVCHGKQLKVSSSKSLKSKCQAFLISL
jgi:hypothetical protein